jgi:hypothetical protein
MYYLLQLQMILEKFGYPDIRKAVQVEFLQLVSSNFTDSSVLTAQS